MIPLKCHKCGNIWPYNGQSKYRTTCPNCHITVYIDKCKVTLKELKDYLREQTEKVIETL